jgi:hypothetical protein
LTKFLNDYKLPLNGIPSPFFGQPATADFTLDFRNTENPVVRNGIIDFKFFGEILYQGHICQLEAEPFDFLEDEEGYIISQLVFTDSAFQCAVNSLAKSPIGNFNFNEDRLNTFFGINYFKFDTTSFAQHMPIFEKKLGKNKPLKMLIKFSHFETKFGKFDSDCLFDYTMGISWY